MFVARVIPVFDNSADLLSDVLEETGGLGVDIVIDSGGEQTGCVCMSAQGLPDCHLHV